MVLLALPPHEPYYFHHLPPKIIRLKGKGVGKGKKAKSFLTHKSTEISAPPKAKSHNCGSHFNGLVYPGFSPHPVRYSTQFGPPSAVAVYRASISPLSNLTVIAKI